MRNEEIIKQFMMGLSILNCYVEFNGKLNLQDINIFAETFLCDLINILFDLELVNANNEKKNNQGYDLISEKYRYIVQVSSTKEPKKIIETLSSLEQLVNIRKKAEDRLSKIRDEKNNDISSYTLETQKTEEKLIKELRETHNIANYKVIFMILTNDASKQRGYRGGEKSGYIVPKEIRFNQDEDIWDFNSLINKIISIPENQLEEDVFYKLELFMKKHNDIFIKRTVLDLRKDRVSRIINEYADNFTEKLFRHRYIEGSNVKLCNLYVDPLFQTEDMARTENIVKILDSFLWDDPMCRVLFVEGDAAVGKTSWVSWLCYHYLKLDEIGKSIFLERRIVCIRLRELDFSEDNRGVEKCILEYLEIESLDEFNKNYSDCIMILDGADEISMVRNLLHTTIEEFITTVRKIFNKNKIIITSRPKFIDVKKFNSRNFSVKSIEIMHYDYKKRMEWIDKYEACGESIAETTKRYIKSIDEKVVSGVADTPLALYLLAACDMKDEFQDNAWALYNEIFKNAIINTEYNENFEFVRSHPIKEKKQIIYDIVCDIAFQMFQNSSEERYYVTGQEVENIIARRDLDGEVSEWAKQSCVLCAYWKSGTNIGALEFYHNNIRDFFFCEYIFEELSKCCSSGNLYGIDDDKFIETMCKVMFYGNISGTTWEQAFSFIYLRLKYELKYKEEGAKSYLANIDFRQMVPRIFCEMLLYKKHVWHYDYKRINYQAVKTTIFNTLLLLRVCQEASDLINGNNDVISLWRKEVERRDINSMGVLREWGELFFGEVKITDKQIVGVGKKCMLSQLNLDNFSGEKVDFSYSDLNSTSIRNSNLKKAILRYAELSNTNFEGANLREADFSNAKLVNTVFTNANIEGANFRRATIEGVVFSGVELKGTDFTNATIKNSDWSMQNLTEVRLDGAKFINCNLRHIKKRKLHIEGVEFVGCNLEKCNFEDSALENITFRKSTLKNSNLVGTSIVRCCFEDMDAIDANIRNTTLIDTRFKNIDASDAAFSQADIIDCYFMGDCKFQRTDFRKTKIGKKSFANLKSQGADLRFINKDIRE